MEKINNFNEAKNLLEKYLDKKISIKSSLYRLNTKIAKIKILTFFSFFLTYAFSSSDFIYLILSISFKKNFFVILENLFVFYNFLSLNLLIFLNLFFSFFYSFFKLISLILWLNISKPLPLPKFIVI